MPAEAETAEHQPPDAYPKAADGEPAGAPAERAEGEPGGAPAERAEGEPGGAPAEPLDVEVSEPDGESHPSEAELDPETIARRDAALARVRKFGDPVLRAVALPVERFDDTLAQEAERMGSLMHDALGVGLAATQLGVLHRLLVYQAYSEDPVTALVNPEIEWRSDELEAGPEGCLSLPGVHVEVERPIAVRVRARDVHGEPLEVEAAGLEARVIQHEIDHLDGILVFDRIPREARKEAMRAMREAMSARRAA